MTKYHFYFNFISPSKIVAKYAFNFDNLFAYSLKPHVNNDMGWLLLNPKKEWERIGVTENANGYANKNYFFSVLFFSFNLIL